jgi:hypothetical protein
MLSQATRSVPSMAKTLSSIDDLARVQLSLVTRQQLIDVGLAPAQIGALLRSRALRPVRPKVYATLGSVRDWRQELMALVLGAGDGAVASHASAARLWNFVRDSERLTAVAGADRHPMVFTDATPDQQIVRDVANALRTAPSDEAFGGSTSA